MRFFILATLIIYRMILSWLVVSQSWASTTFLHPVENQSVTNLEILTPVLAVYDRFEARFDLKTTATHYHLPFDSQPPPGLQQINGITVDAIFTTPGGDQIIQPAFWYQPFRWISYQNKDHYTPTEKPHWSVRFTPRQAGDWRMRVKIQDSSGIRWFPETGYLNFNVSGVSSHPFRRNGFIRVSQDDPRYFEFESGEYFSGAGFNQYITLSEAQRLFPLYSQNKINLLRIWLSAFSINGSQWSAWGSHHLSENGYLPGILLDSQNPYKGTDVSMMLDEGNPCVFDGWVQGPVSVQPSTQYTLTLKVKLSQISGPATHGEYGFVVKTGEWLDKTCNQAGTGQRLTPLVTQTDQWIDLTSSFTTGKEQNYLDHLYLALENTRSGKAFIHEVHLYQTNDPFKIDLLREPYANSHLYFDPINASLWDQILQLAEDNGIYLKLVCDEKNEPIRNQISPNGSIQIIGENNNFYAREGTKVRWLAHAWWRWIIARWGYSTAIHSFEYINEGDPYNSNHYEAAQDMATYFQLHDASGHLVSTSFWHSFPNREFWSNPEYSNLGYADLHAYISTGWGSNASFLNIFPLETRPEHIYQGNGSAHLPAAVNGYDIITPRGIVLRQKGEWIIRYWMKAERYSVICPLFTSGGMQRLRWTLDGKKTNIIPPDPFGNMDRCSSPAGTYDWRQFSSDRDQNGILVSPEFRLIIPDDLPHELELGIETRSAFFGAAWIDQVDIISPDGRIVPVIGSFDSTAFQEDTAWYHISYASLYSASSPVSIQKPLIRGEGGIDDPKYPDFHPDLFKDKEGIWLHKLVWAQLSAGGMIDLLWWADQLIDENPTQNKPAFYQIFKRYQSFIEGIQLSNGFFQDWKAVSNHPHLVILGQVDPIHGMGYAWMYNRNHTWKKVINQESVQPVSAAKPCFPGMAPGFYQVDWWDPYRTSNPIIQSDRYYSAGILCLNLPFPIDKDIALKIRRVYVLDGSSIPPRSKYLPAQ